MKFLVHRTSDPDCRKKPCKKAVYIGCRYLLENFYTVSIKSLKDLIELQKEVGAKLLFVKKLNEYPKIVINDCTQKKGGASVSKSNRTTKRAS